MYILRCTTISVSVYTWRPLAAAPLEEDAAGHRLRWFIMLEPFVINRRSTGRSKHRG